MKLTTGVTLLLLSAVDNDFFFMSQVLTMKLSESTNICYIVIGLSVQLNGISKKLSRKTMVLLEFSEGRTDSCYSIITLGNLWTHVKQGWYYKVWQTIMNPPELLSKLLEANFEVYLE